MGLVAQAEVNIILILLFEVLKLHKSGHLLPEYGPNCLSGKKRPDVI